VQKSNIKNNQITRIQTTKIIKQLAKSKKAKRRLRPPLKPKASLEA